MNASLKVDGKTVQMKPFVETYLANVCDAVLRSLKGTDGFQRAVFIIQAKRLQLLVDDQTLDLHMDKGFAGVIVRDTILGVLSHLRGTRSWTVIQVELQL
jgi:hypothetical protein